MTTFTSDSGPPRIGKTTKTARKPVRKTKAVVVLMPKTKPGLINSGV